jgi:hypothetical protein
MDAHFETLAAWADGETVDRADVLRALDTAEGRDYIVDVMALRRMVAITTPVPAAEAVGHPASARTRSRNWIAVPLAAAAVLCVAVGYTAGRVSSEGAPLETPTVVPVSTAAAPAAPTPTHVIRFEAGVDWRENAGGD